MFDSPRLVADIGGTHARFALQTAPGRFEHSVTLRSAEHADFHAAVSAYLATLPALQIRHAGVAIANPVVGDQVQMTNRQWQFSIEAMRQRLGLTSLVLVNDFTALALALPGLAAGDMRQIGGGAPDRRAVIGLLGPGTGLGVSGLLPAGDGWVALSAEGGHASFAPRDEREIALLRFAWRQFEHVSCERLLSGAGLELIYRALAEPAGLPDQALPAAEISARALAGSDGVCRDALQLFCTLLGTAAANLALTLGARGGIYIGGGIVPRLGSFFDASPFRARFEDQGRFSAYLAAIPTYLITAPHATFIGAAAALDARLHGGQT